GFHPILPFLVYPLDNSHFFLTCHKWGTVGLWLRWYDETGWIPTPAERAEEERQRAEQMERALAEERQRVQQLLEQLRSLGVNPDVE
ncbi:hypothetical protein QUA03_08660, partial [Microcoleus sp. S36b_A4]